MSSRLSATRKWGRGLLVAAALAALLGTTAPALGQQRVLGIDVSAWQGNLSTTTWATFKRPTNQQVGGVFGDGRDFAFIRSSRGGTTGYYNQSDPDNLNGLNTLSQRYDDPYFVQNITRATNAGMFAGPYHYGRADIIASTTNANGIPNNGTDEANHFIEMAGAWMRPGYLLPVFDLEAGNSQHTTTSLSNFSLAFSDRIYEVVGIRPIVYANSSYVNDEVNASVATSMPNLWIARPTSGDPLTTEPPAAASYPNVYGKWNPSYPTIPNPQPWKFWQYDTSGGLNGYAGDLDKDAANGGTEFLKDFLIPALWMNDTSGNWTTLANWNSGQTPVAPVQGPGQVPRFGSLTLPTTRLPGANDTVILDRPSASIDVTLSSGTHNIRKLYVRETLNITGGSLTVNYVPAADSTPIAAQFSGAVTLSGAASLSVHTLQVDATRTLTLGGGTLTLNTINLMPHSTTPAKILVSGDVSFSSLANAAAAIANGAGAGSSGLVDLGGGNRAFNVANGSANVDLSVNVPVINGALTKTGAGTLALNGASSYAGDTTVQAGKLSLGNAILANAADVYLATGATLDLIFGGAPDIIDSLFIDGVSKAVGTWGAVGSGAQNFSPLITGTGYLQVTTFIPPPLWGDYNENGVVDAGDYVVWRDSLGSETSLPNDDTMGVGPDDFDRWRIHFGESNLGGAGSASGAAAPEPTSAVLLAIAWGLLQLACCPRRA